MPFYTYILYDKNRDQFYIGQTNDIDKRVKRHNQGREKYTKRGKWELVHFEKFETRSAAIKQEKQIKQMKSKMWIKKLIKNAQLVEHSDTR